jgi:VanZ family protein
MIRHLNALSPKMRVLAAKAARITAWILAFAIVVLSIVPPGLRPETNMPHMFEHFAIFFATGAAFACGYGQRALEVAIALVAFAGLIEIAQIYVPGRHARVSDFIVDAAALCVGIALASLVGAKLQQLA